jgi:ABC-type polysaccharide/polyol phosphate transport system ATPase subunit
MPRPEDNGAGPVVVAENLSKVYRLGELHSLQQTVNRLLRRGVGVGASLNALDRVSFTVARGDALGIVGTNGSGKSTVLQILAGTTLPTGGWMTVAGRVLPLLAVGTGFHGELTGTENVTLFASSLGVPRAAIAKRIGAVGEFAELERHMDTPVKRFSSGMLSRLSFAIAMQFPADIYVFDEVLAVVDGEFQARCVREISNLHKAGRTVIFVSHDLDQVAAVCQTVMWLDAGRVERIGSANEVLDAYRSAHGAEVGRIAATSPRDGGRPRA